MDDHARLILETEHRTPDAIGRRISNLAASLVIALIVLPFLSCGYSHYYDVTGYESKLPSGVVSVDMWQTQILKGEDIGNAEIDSGGTLWVMNLTYRPTRGKPKDVVLSVDSVRVLLPSLGTSRPIDRSRWLKYQSDNSTTIKISPISLPRNSYPDLIIELLLIIQSRVDGAVVEQKKYQFRCAHKRYANSA